MISLSVNVNKIATLRNSRGGSIPNVIEAVDTVLAAGAPGVTVHPRADERHIRRRDVFEIAEWLKMRSATGARPVEFNVEGDPRPDFVEMVLEVRPDQCTLVPVMPGEVTSQAGWPPDSDPGPLRAVVRQLRDDGIRVSVFIDPEAASVKWAAGLDASRVEFYTEPFAKACRASVDAGRASFERYVAAAELAHSLGLGVNAGHDLDLENLVLFRSLPFLDEVSIGHALVSRALWVGLDRSVRDYLELLNPGGSSVHLV